ncbi:MAG: 16S rRNA (guanine(966)-N(2))-methyltransferase RsmD [Candidatus Omnitrophota bacterium]
MRIIGGRFKGKRIDMPKEIRPTSDKVREALFEIFKDRIEGAGFLDLYCGSGAVGIEAISRGAKSVSFVDNNPMCISGLKKNLKAQGPLELSSIDIYKGDVLKAFERFVRLSSVFDIVFLDPPYYREIAKNTLIALSNYDILARNAVIVVEIHKKETLPEKVGSSIRKIRICRYGDTKLEFFKR